MNTLMSKGKNSPWEVTLTQIARMCKWAASFFGPYRYIYIYKLNVRW